MMIHLLLSLILSIEIIVMTDFIMVLRGIHFKLSLYGLSMLSLFVLLAFVVKASSGIMLAAIMTILMIPCLMYLLWLPFARSSRDFEDVDNGKAECYGGKKVMLIVPHQDDEINVLGGVLEEYLKYGSEVYIVYVITNGMVSGFRYTEAFNLCKRIGIPSKNITFLGYGSMRDGENEIPPTTKGTKDIPAYKEGQAYTRENIVKDLKEIILFQKPEIIYGSDYDYHIDHHLASIAIDEALGKVLKEQHNYCPFILKSYAYRTTWESYPDYYGSNLRSTKYKKAEVETYPWEERLRLPIAAHMLNRSLLHSEIFRQYRTFKSQGAVMRAINFNTDKVAWLRRSDSLLLNAKVDVSSGNGNRLNDFLLYDKTNMSELDYIPSDGALISDEKVKKKESVFTLKNKIDIKYLLIYQNPVAENVIEQISISFNGKSPLEYSLRTDGYPTHIDVNKRDVSYFTIKIVKSKGDYAGITEVEAFEKSIESPFSFIKLMNKTDDFIFDYWINKSGEESLDLYSVGMTTPLSEKDYSISIDNPRCRVSIMDSKVIVCCPVNETGILYIESKDAKYSDTVLISNPNSIKRIKYTLGQKIEAMCYDIFIGDQHRKATTLSMYSLIKNYAHAIRLQLR